MNAQVGRVLLKVARLVERLADLAGNYALTTPLQAPLDDLADSLFTSATRRALKAVSKRSRKG